MKFSPFDRSPEPDLSPDLEWLLQSGRASDEILIEALVGEHFAEVCILAVELLGDIQQAQALAARVLADGILNMHAYSADTSVRSWLLSLLKKRARTWQTEDKPSGDLSQAGKAAGPVCAVLSEQDIERIISQVQEIVEGQRSKQRFTGLREFLIVSLVILSVLFAGRWMGRFTPEPTPQPTRFHTALVTQLVFISPTPPPRAAPTPFPERAILYPAESGDTLASIAEKTGIDTVLLQALNSLDPDSPLKPGQAVMLGLGGVPLAHITPTPVTPAPLPEPLTTASQPVEVFQRIFESERYWYTLWVEAEAIDYEPPGSTGQPEVKRLQAWISRPFFSLALLGDPDGSVERVALTNSGRTYNLDTITGERNFTTSYALVLMQLDELIQQSFSNFDTGSEQEIRGIEQVAGREALVLDWFWPETSPDGQTERVRRGSYWVDTRTGVILRSQRFGQDPEAGEFLVSETIIKEIAFDVDLKNALFDPYLPLPSRFAQNEPGDPHPGEQPLSNSIRVGLTGRELPRKAQPARFSPERSRLTFQWTFGSAFDNDQSTLTDIFAGRFYLGSIDMGDPDRLICARSPDGRKIAFSEWLEGPGAGAAPLRWLDLNDLNQIYEPMPTVRARVLAFSPDSGRLALLGSEGVNDLGLYLLDLASGDWQRIQDLCWEEITCCGVQMGDTLL
jgi:hypothetical protein